MKRRQIYRVPCDLLEVCRQDMMSKEAVERSDEYMAGCDTFLVDCITSTSATHVMESAWP